MSFFMKIDICKMCFMGMVVQRFLTEMIKSLTKTFLNVTMTYRNFDQSIFFANFSKTIFTMFVLL
eukprot:UN10447